MSGTIVAALAAEFNARQPAVALRLRESAPAVQHRALVEQRLDAAVLRLPFDTAQLTLGPVVQRPLGIPIAGNDPLAGHPELLLSLLAPLALVIFRRSTAPVLFDEILDTCARHGYRPSTVHEVSSTEFGRGLVIAGGAVAFDDGALAPPAGAVWRPVTGEPLAARLATVWPRGRDNPAVRAFAETAALVLQREAGMNLVGPARPGTTLRARPTSEFLPWSAP